MQTQLFPSRGWTSCCCNLILLHLVFNCITLHHLHTVTALFIGNIVFSVLSLLLLVVEVVVVLAVEVLVVVMMALVRVLLLVLEGKNVLLGYFEKAFTELLRVGKFYLKRASKYLNLS